MEKNRENAVELQNIKFSYDGNITTINDVSCQIKRGEYCCLIGHNGSGKSTLARLIIGLLEQNEGHILVFGEEMTDDNVLNLRRHLGIIFQNPDNQFIGSSVRDDIAFGLENDCVDETKMDDIVDEFASKVGMKDFLDKEPSNLSGGQKQRVAIAGVLARHPDIFIMDEATSMLDPKGKSEIISLIHKMKEENENLTVISITHDIQEAYNSDHVIVLANGQKVLDGEPYEIFSQKDLMKKYQLDIPFYMNLDDELAKRGIDVKGVNSLEGLVDKLCK